MSTPSTLIADRYRLVKLLGAGGMGIVWQAWDERLHRPVALKMLRTQPELTDSERQVATDRAMREARITAGLRHPHAVTVFDVIEHDGQPCIVMELLESTPLSVLLSEHGTVTPSEAARIGAQVGSALAAAHKLRIVHRDVKPGNILMTADGSAMISDFGISHALGDTTITATGMIHGTPAYLAPEVARGMPTTFASDVFSLGSTLYAALEGSPPFGSERNAIALLHKVARGGYPPPTHAGPLAPLLNQMLAADPKRRPSMASATDSLSQLRDADGGPVTSGLAVTTEATMIPIVGAPDDGNRPPPPTSPVEDATTEALEEDSATPGIQDAVTRPATAVLPDAVTRPAAAPREPTAETLPVDRPTRYEPPTAETEPLAGAGSARAASGAASTPAASTGTGAPEESAPRTGRRAAVVAGIALLVVALLIGAVVLLNSLRPDVDSAAGPTAGPTPSATTPAETPEADAVAPSPSAAPPPAEESEPEPPPATPEERVVETISTYYAMLPEDRDTAWPTMTADYQENHAGGRGGYEAFWAPIADVTVADVRATAPDRGQATLTYHFRDGRVIQEVTSYRFVEEGGALKIAETEVLSSVEQ
jgi:serine/threonine protein kinase